MAVLDKAVAVIGFGRTVVYPNEDASGGAAPSSQAGDSNTDIPDQPDAASEPSQFASSDGTSGTASGSYSSGETVPADKAGVAALGIASAASNSETIGFAPAPPSSELSNPPFAVGFTPAPAGGVSVVGGGVTASENYLPAEKNSEATSTAQPSGATSTDSGAEAPSAMPSVENFSASFVPEALSFNFSWTPLAVPGATSTIIYDIADAGGASGPATLLEETSSTGFSWPVGDFGKNYIFSLQAFAAGGSGSTSSPQAVSAISTTTASAADYLVAVQPADAEDSHGSWYSDNWYNLGSGFYGTVYAMVFKGRTDGDTAGGMYRSRLRLSEFLDRDYTVPNKTFVLSDDAPFATVSAPAIISGLNVPLQSNKYYRLDTLQGRQNISVILQGTSATGTAMWDTFAGGIGRVETVYSFYPYLQLIMKKDFPPQSAPTPPAGLSFEFDPVNYNLGISWSGSTDADTTGNLLTYEVNVSTSTDLADDGWTPVAGFSTSTGVVFPQPYTVGVRALDDFRNISSPNVARWNFPDGFAVLPQQLGRDANLRWGMQRIFINASATIDKIMLYTQAGYGVYCCSASYLNIYTDNGGVLGEIIATSTGVTLRQGNGAMEAPYNFSEPVRLLGGNYYWIVPQEFPDAKSNGTAYFGSADDAYAGGFWSTRDGAATGEDLYFRLRWAGK